MCYFERTLIALPRLITSGLLLVLSIGLAAPVAAQTDHVGQGAGQGDFQAQLTLGFMYFDGVDGPQDYGGAARWNRKAADQGNAQAGVELGSMYEKGQGVPQDYGKAAKW